MSMTLSAPVPVPALARRARRRSMLARYSDLDGRSREVVAFPGPAGSTLVVDRLGVCGDDRDERLVAHLGADEPASNAGLIAAAYVADRRRRPALLARRLRADDLEHVPFAGGPPRAGDGTFAAPRLRDRAGAVYELGPVGSPTKTLRELRWQRLGGDGRKAVAVVSVRDVIGALEDYEPARSLSVRAIAAREGDERISVATLRAELQRLAGSRIVLNRRLREVVLAAVAREGVSMSEIALRCERVKRDARGNESGETSWLARRLGLQAEGGEASATPWIHSDVLALIARRGLGLCPLEVEL